MSTYDDTRDYAPLHDALIVWFEQHKADLPWRRTKDPYAIWLSEIMLQQTQVTTVIGYYQRFITRFPTVEALATAPLDDVLKLWEGLGYYSRAQNLHRAAQMVVERHGGAFPANQKELLNLPGVGRYTAGAVASLAFGLDEPVLDGNVIRVLTRLFDIDDVVGQTATKNMLWNLVARLLPAGRAGVWNEGLMELGRRICTPTSPDCDACPLADHCAARQLGNQHERPVKLPRSKTPHYDVTAAVIRHADGRLLIAQRPHDGMLGGLWEFPGGKRQPGESLPDCLRREIREELDIEIAVGEQIGTVRHAYSHFRITLYAYACEYLAGEPQATECADWAWVEPGDLDNYAFPVTDQKIIGMLRDGGGQLGMDFGD
ncbi:MAG: A/G-specific adenine glycosylase [Anaerolineae bacterium]|nr:A/G-specific adenine glycosylase [Anaerolineae bacterium]